MTLTTERFGSRTSLPIERPLPRIERPKHRPRGQPSFTKHGTKHDADGPAAPRPESPPPASPPAPADDPPVASAPAMSWTQTIAWILVLSGSVGVPLLRTVYLLNDGAPTTLSLFIPSATLKGFTDQTICNQVNERIIYSITGYTLFVTTDAASNEDCQVDKRDLNVTYLWFPLAVVCLVQTLLGRRLRYGGVLYSEGILARVGDLPYAILCFVGSLYFMSLFLPEYYVDLSDTDGQQSYLQWTFLKYENGDGSVTIPPTVYGWSVSAAAIASRLVFGGAAFVLARESFYRPRNACGAVLPCLSHATDDVLWLRARE
tara:strand:- start:3085 stop:4035 length:951 start_codon:yes stop_codon:yes gene_type:complete